MQDGVKFIFKTLLKVPIIILVSFAVFNLFAFCLSYFKLLGISYVAMQTAVENNYIPTEEFNTLENYLNNTMATYMLENPKLECDTGSGNKRVQYGGKVTVTVSAHYRFIWPLTPKEQTGLKNSDDVNAVAGQNGTTTRSFSSNAQLEAARMKYENNTANNIIITYTVPGLKYYPDLS